MGVCVGGGGGLIRQSEGLCKGAINIDSRCVRIPCDAMNLFVSERP